MSRRAISWHTASELAGLPGLPGTPRGVTKFAETAGWQDERSQYRKRRGKGGGREYRANVLPEETQNYLARRMLLEAEPVAPGPPDEMPAGRKAQARQEAALLILAAWDRHRPATKGGLTAARDDFCHLYNRAEIDGLPGWALKVRPSLTAATLQAYENRRAANLIAELGGKYGNRKGSSVIETDGEINALVLGLIADKPHVKARAVERALKARFEDGRALPSLRALQRWMRAWKSNNGQAYLAAANPDKWRSKYQAAAGSKSAGITRLNQVWEMDSTPTDVLLSDGRRHAIVGVIDVFSRRVRYLVAPTSRATSVAAVLRWALLEWGVPEILKTDNGADYVSRHIKRVLAGLEIHQEICPPFTPEAKPHIERSFKTFSHGIVELLDGYIGHDVAGRKDIEARRSFAERYGGDDSVRLNLTPEQLQEVCDTWALGIYEREVHSGFKGALAGKTPFEVANGWTGTIRRIENPRALDILLAGAPGGSGWRTVGKKGIAVEGRHYIAGELGGLIGDKVQVRYDEADVGRMFVFDADGGYLCQAEAPEITGVSREEVAAKMRADQKDRLAEAKGVLRQAKKLGRP
ncbi:MAG: DDE-type integrase/transposase/recombinase, partial [Rhodospirillaceae bacterium]|nr:DDE-type integrase/transposase/recombinase [Rhodospirillaceae bacterium]